MSTSSETQKPEEIEGRSFNDTYTIDDQGRIFNQQPLYTLTEGDFFRLTRSTPWIKFLELTLWGVAVTFLLIGVAKTLWSRLSESVASQDPTTDYVVAGLAVLLGAILHGASRIWKSDRDKLLDTMKKYFEKCRN